MHIHINKNKTTNKPEILEVEVVKSNIRTSWVRLPQEAPYNGKVIKVKHVNEVKIHTI